MSLEEGRLRIKHPMTSVNYFYFYTNNYIMHSPISKMKSREQSIRSCTHWKTPCIEILSRRKLTFSAPSIQYRG